ERASEKRGALLAQPLRRTHQRGPDRDNTRTRSRINAYDHPDGDRNSWAPIPLTRENEGKCARSSISIKVGDSHGGLHRGTPSSDSTPLSILRPKAATVAALVA